MVEAPRTIGDHGIIGDLETAALVAGDGTIDYLCWPALDSPTIFADLLDNEKGGVFSITPKLNDAQPPALYPRHQRADHALDGGGGHRR
jgi:GH15 family glucan-1,4-alpha-glucosidase